MKLSCRAKLLNPEKSLSIDNGSFQHGEQMSTIIDRYCQIYEGLVSRQGTFSRNNEIALRAILGAVSVEGEPEMVAEKILAHAKN